MSLALVHIGMMKAGSTWLHHWLSAHPELAAPFGKNAYFWNREHPLARHHKHRWPIIPAEDYRAAVASVSKAIDVTDSYSFMWEWQISALLAEHPDVLVTYALRDPVEALWSHMAMHSVSLEDLASSSPKGDRPPDHDRMLANAHAGDNLYRWRAAGFDPQLIGFEQIRTDPLGVLRLIAELLGVDPAWWDARADEVAEPVNPPERPRAELTPAERERLEEIILA